MLENLEIQSHVGPYSVTYAGSPGEAIAAALLPGCVVIADARVAELYAADFAVLDGTPCIFIEADEDAKSIAKIVPVLEQLAELGLKRSQTLVAIGGGVVQDIACFIASVFMRGIPWHFVPTTLLAQADSAIGSKSSVNMNAGKNILGTFYPPKQIFVGVGFLQTLPDDEVRSGIGEIIKVHAIDGPESFDYLAGKFDQLVSDDAVLAEFISRALRIKKRYIEIDEFDRGPRKIFNFGHSFGHAIETATHYGIPHGIAVTMGMKIANDFAVALGKADAGHRDRMLGILQQNYASFADYAIDAEAVFHAMAKDKKNSDAGYGIIIPVGAEARIEAITVKPDQFFLDTLKAALAL
ncbi:iron-containing alcohol dehydrogenase [Devosia sp. J2-20]|uniref:AroB-related putative sugar phosphate phospholyase (cyclizing) n=1 Tax=Devosia sp. J2-20 TaxID=3026161 RepID=UPI002499BC16|nr:AroB-related putative sugar phosphate phospholyase (cyclizing) [Devosia sp. J2-20]WDR00480.1 iron-containing alcohol dehydrogenase [Devosia sp. J2-20]